MDKHEPRVGEVWEFNNGTGTVSRWKVLGEVYNEAKGVRIYRRALAEKLSGNGKGNIGDRVNVTFENGEQRRHNYWKLIIPASTAPCATCDRPAEDNDYLCRDCRHENRNESKTPHSLLPMDLQPNLRGRFFVS